MEDGKPKDEPKNESGSEPKDEKQKETPAQPSEPPKSVDPSTEIAALRGMLESFGAKLSSIESASQNPPPGPGQTEAEKVLVERLDADLAALPEAHANAIREIMGNNPLLGMKVVSALTKAGVFAPPKTTPAAPSDKQDLSGGSAGSAAPTSWEEATSRIASGLANPRL